MRRGSILFLLFLALMLSGCWEASENFSSEELLRLEAIQYRPRGGTLGIAAEPPTPIGTVGAGIDLDLTVIALPKGYSPLGMLSAEHGYLLDRERPEVLWLYDFSRESFTAAIDYRESEFHVGEEIALSERWLVWLQIAPYRLQENGSKEREVRLMARDRSDPDAEAIVIDIGYNSPAEGFYLPFDSLGLDDDLLVYRYSVFEYGWRDTEVRLADLGSGELFVLGLAHSNAGRQILHCSIADRIIAWDVQINYLQEYPSLPSQPKSLYNLHCYYLDIEKVIVGNSPEVLVANSDHFYWPIVYQSSLYALSHQEPRLQWDRISSGGQGDVFILQRTIESSIVSISPQFRSGQTRVFYDYFHAGLIDIFREKRLPRSIQMDNIHIGKRILSWQSNVSDHHLVYDIPTARYALLPVYFAEIPPYGDEGLWGVEVLIEDGFWGQTRKEMSAPAPESVASLFLEGIWVRPVNGIDADYLLFGLVSGAEDPYILRIE